MEKPLTVREIIAAGGPGAEKLNATINRIVARVMETDEETQLKVIHFLEDLQGIESSAQPGAK